MGRSRRVSPSGSETFFNARRDGFRNWGSTMGMDTLAVVLEGPERLAVRRLALNPHLPSDVIVDIEWTGISTGTERLLWNGTMPAFPGMGYPLVPGYESVGRIVDAGSEVKGRIGERVFVPGANCYVDAKGLFGGAADEAARCDVGAGGKTVVQSIDHPAAQVEGVVGVEVVQFEILATRAQERWIVHDFIDDDRHGFRRGVGQRNGARRLRPELRAARHRHAPKRNILRRGTEIHLRAKPRQSAGAIDRGQTNFIAE